MRNSLTNIISRAKQSRKREKTESDGGGGDGNGVERRKVSGERENRQKTIFELLRI